MAANVVSTKGESSIDDPTTLRKIEIATPVSPVDLLPTMLSYGASPKVTTSRDITVTLQKGFDQHHRRCVECDSNSLANGEVIFCCWVPYPFVRVYRVVLDHMVGKLITLGVGILFNVDAPITACCTAEGLSNHCTFPCRTL
jgi:hypothetical protein